MGTNEVINYVISSVPPFSLFSGVSSPLRKGPWRAGQGHHCLSTACSFPSVPGFLYEYIFVYLCVYVCAQMCVDICIYASVHVYIIYICLSTHLCVYTYRLDVHACMYVCGHLCMCLHMCKELCIGWASHQELPFSIVSQVLPGLYHPKFHAYQPVLF